MEVFLCFFEFLGIFRVHRSRQPKLSIVGDFESMIKVLRFDDRENRPKHFLLCDARFGINVDDNRGRNEVAISGSAFAAEDQLAFFLAYINVAQK